MYISLSQGRGMRLMGVFGNSFLSALLAIHTIATHHKAIRTHTPIKYCSIVEKDMSNIDCRILACRYRDELKTEKRPSIPACQFFPPLRTHTMHRFPSLYTNVNVLSRRRDIPILHIRGLCREGGIRTRRNHFYIRKLLKCIFPIWSYAHYGNPPGLPSFRLSEGYLDTGFPAIRLIAETTSGTTFAHCTAFLDFTLSGSSA